MSQVAQPSSATEALESTSEKREPRRNVGRVLALLLALLITFALVVWTAGPRPASGYGRIVGTIISGQLALTATASTIGCTAWTNGTAGGNQYARFGYRLANLGDVETAASVIVAMTSHGFHVVAQHPYTLGPHEVVEDTIGADVAYLGSCPSTPLSLGLSSQGSA